MDIKDTTISKIGGEELVGKTHFVDDSAQIIAGSKYSGSMVPNDITLKDMGIRDFLANPVMIFDSTTIPWTNSLPVNSQLGAYVLSGLVNSWAYNVNKIQGFNLIRGTICLRVVLNPTPFMVGRLMLSFLPAWTDWGASFDPTYAGTKAVSLNSAAMLPNVTIDCRDGVGIMKIPYVSPYRFFDIKQGVGDFGICYLRVLSQLEFGPGASETTCDYAVYGWLEDVELAAPLVPQSNVDFFSGFREQGKRKFLAVTEKERHVATGGTVSRLLKAGSKFAGSLGEIPVISAAMGQLEWVLNAASGAASAFGWSKPTIDAPLVVVTSGYNRYSATATGADSAIPLALIANNSTKVTDDISIRDEDEMSLAFLLKVPALFSPTNTANNGFQWAASNVQGTPLISMPIFPQNFYIPGTISRGTHTANYIQGPPLFYLSYLFAYYRGSIEIIFKFVKSDFHSGRLQITFTPSRQLAVTAPTISTGQLALREIVDIKSSNEVVLKLPFLHNIDYLPVGTSMGQLDVVVLNELRAPDSVFQNIDVLMYARAGDDFEFAVPTTLSAQAFSLQSNLGFFTEQSNDAFGTSGKEMAVDTVIGGMDHQQLSTYHSEACIGEHVTSIKQLLNRYSIVKWLTINANPLSTQIKMWPWFSSILSLNGTTGLSGGSVGGDTYSFLAPMFLGYRGSVKMNIVPIFSSSNNTGNNLFATITPGGLTPGTSPVINMTSTVTSVPYWDAAASLATNTSIPSTGIAVTDPTLGQSSFVVPYYNQTRFSYVYNAFSSASSVVPNDPTQPIACLNIGIPNKFSTASINRSFGDEFQLAYFLGCPPIYVSST
jgi:hypothetical protein